MAKLSALTFTTKVKQGSTVASNNVKVIWMVDVAIYGDPFDAKGNVGAACMIPSIKFLHKANSVV